MSNSYVTSFSRKRDRNITGNLFNKSSKPGNYKRIIISWIWKHWNKLIPEQIGESIAIATIRQDWLSWVNYTVNIINWLDELHLVSGTSLNDCM